MEPAKKQSLSGRGDYLPITPMKSKGISSDVLKDAALPNPAKIKVPAGSGSGSWWGGGSGADAGPSWDMPAPPKKKKTEMYGQL